MRTGCNAIGTDLVRLEGSVLQVSSDGRFPPALPPVQVTKMPKKTLDVQVTTLDAVLEFSIEVGGGTTPRPGTRRSLCAPMCTGALKPLCVFGSCFEASCARTLSTIIIHIH